MDSQESQEVNVVRMLVEAADWTDQETLQKLPDTLQIVNNFLETSPTAEASVQVARFVFGSFLSHLQVDKNSFGLFNAALPCLKSAFDDFLQDCKREAEKNMDRVSEILQQCSLVTECCELAVQFLLQAETVAVENVRSLPQVLLHIINLSLDHCKNSAGIYGSQLERVKETLSALFQHTVDLSTQFANFLSTLTFNSICDDDMGILLLVSEQLCVTASCLSQLSEIRCSVVVWRAYTSFIQQHHGELVTRVDISVPLASLVKEVKDGLCLIASIPVENATMAEKDQKVVQRIIKMTSFCLKVIIALCDRFRGYLRGSQSLMVSLLLLLFRFAPHNVTLQTYPDNIKNDIERQATIGIEPLLLHLRDDEEFVKMMLKIEVDEAEIVEEDWGSYLLLLLAVCFPPSAINTLYISTFITKIFKTVAKCHASLSFPCMMNGVMCRGRPHSKVTLYEHLLTRVCALVATLENQTFKVLEEVLVQWLLSGQIWPALLAADVWCFIARFGNSDLCRSHCTLLMDVLPETCPSSHQHLITASLLSRLIPKLAPQHKQEILSSFKDTGLNAVNKFMMLQAGTEDGTSNIELISDVMDTCTETMNIVLSRNATEQTVMKLMDELKYMAPLLLVFTHTENKNTAQIANFTTVITQLWTRIPEDYISCSLVDLMLSNLLTATSSVLSCLSNNQLLQILSVCKVCCTNGSAIVGVGLCGLVESFGHCHLSQSLECSSILSLISDIISELLKSSNPLVHQCALDAFVVFGQHTIHEEVLSVCLTNCEKRLQDRVTSYLQQEPHALPPGLSRMLLLQQQNVSTIDMSQLQKNLKPIEDNAIPVFSQTHSEESVFQDLCDQEQNPPKRLREDDFPLDKVLDLKTLINSLQDSQNMMKNIDVTIEEREKVKAILQEMINIWDMKV